MSALLRGAFVRGRLAAAPGVVLAAHGEGDGSEVNERIVELARRAQQLSGRRVTAAFRLGTPNWRDLSSSPESTNSTNSTNSTDSPRLPRLPRLVIPLLAAEGHFATAVLPRAMGLDPHLLRPPLALHRAVLDGVVEQVQLAIANPGSNSDSSSTALLVVGHGTERHPASGSAADRLAQRLYCEFPEISAIGVGFLDQEPQLEPAVRTLVRRVRPSEPSQSSKPARLLVVPFLIGGAHVRRDLRRRIGSASAGALAEYLPPLVEVPSLLTALLAELVP